MAFRMKETEAGQNFDNLMKTVDEQGAVILERLGRGELVLMSLTQLGDLLGMHDRGSVIDKLQASISPFQTKMHDRGG